MARPRRFPEGTTASARVAASVAALVEAGGARRTFRLSPEANTALETLLKQPGAPASATALVERLLLTAAAKHARQTSKRNVEAQADRKLNRLLKQYDAD